MKKSVDAAAEYQVAIANVSKTTGLAGDELKKFEKGISGMAGKIAVGKDEMLEIAAAAGQLGIKGSDDLLKFTETMSKLSLATDVSGEEGAKDIARLLTVTGEGVGVVDRFGSALTALGNNAAASESEILHMSTFLGQATSAFRLSSAEILGLAASMKSMGLGRIFQLGSRSRNGRPQQARSLVCSSAYRELHQSLAGGEGCRDGRQLHARRNGPEERPDSSEFDHDGRGYPSRHRCA